MYWTVCTKLCQPCRVANLTLTLVFFHTFERGHSTTRTDDDILEFEGRLGNFSGTILDFMISLYCRPLEAIPCHIYPLATILHCYDWGHENRGILLKLFSQILHCYPGAPHVARHEIVGLFFTPTKSVVEEIYLDTQLEQQ